MENAQILREKVKDLEFQFARLRSPNSAEALSVKKELNGLRSDLATQLEDGEEKDRIESNISSTQEGIERIEKSR